MRKKWRIALGFIALCLAATVTANAQIGIHAGYVHSKYAVEGALPGFMQNKPYDGFEAGIDNRTDIIGGILAVRYGLTYTYVEQDLLPVLNYDAKRAGHYLDIPVHLQAGVPLGIVRIYAFGGPKFVMGLSSRTIYTNGESSLVWRMYNGDLVSSGNVDNALDANVDNALATCADSEGKAYKRFDIQLGVGVGVELFGILNVTAGYDWGLFNQSKIDGVELKRNQFNVGVGIAF